MEKTTRVTDAAQYYATAYDAHYTTKEMQKAFNLYERVIAEFPTTQEAEYSRAQIENIVNAVVPKQNIADTLAKLALAHFKQAEPQKIN